MKEDAGTVFQSILKDETEVPMDSDDDCLPRRPRITMKRRRELIYLAEETLKNLCAAGVKMHELCFIRRAAQMFIDE